MSKSPQGLAILFWLDKQRGRDGCSAIYVRFTLDYKRVELATRLYVDPSQWNKKSQTAKARFPDSAEINQQLAIIRADLHRHHARLVALDIVVTAEVLKNAYLGIDERQKTLRELLSTYEERFTGKVEAGRKAVNTLKSVRTMRDKVLAFVKYKFKVSDIPLSNIKSRISNIGRYSIGEEVNSKQTNL